MAKIIVAPQHVTKEDEEFDIRLFLAGGITNCPVWQNEVIKILQKVDKLLIYNPRRKNFPINDPLAAQEQIMWEYNRLKNSNVLLFWFCNTTLNPIALYELGKWGNSSTIPLFIGIEPGYKREADIRMQTVLARPSIKIVMSLQELGKQVLDSL